MLRRLLGLRADDRRVALIGFSTLVLIMAAHAMLETARDTLFLMRLPAESLPFCYLGIAALAVGAARLNQKLPARWDKRRVLAATLVIAGAITFGLWFVIGGGTERSLYVLYIWSGLAATVTVVQTWLMMGDYVTVSQAKRVFAVIGAGAVFGATLGSFVAERVIVLMDPRDLVLDAGLTFVAAALVPLLSMRHKRAHAAATTSRLRTRQVPMGVGMIRSQPYLRRLLLLVLLSTIVLTGSDYVFKTVVTQELAADELPLFFARFYLGLNFLALLIQLFLSSLLLRVLGVSRALLVLPVLMLFGIAGVGAGSAMISVLLLKGADGSLRHSVHRTATEVLYLPLPSDVRERFKAIIDALGQRGGQAVASIAILGAVYVGAGPQHLAMALGLLITLWVIALLDIKRHYLDLFRGNLREGTIETRAGLTELDLHSLEALVGALNSESDPEVLAALDLFHKHQRMRLVPVLLLYHPSNAVVLRSLELFVEAGRDDFGPVARRLLRSDDGEVRAAALRALASLSVDEGLLRSALEDPEPLVHTTALVGLVSRLGHDDAELSADLERHLCDPSGEVRRSMATAIRYQKDPSFADALVALADSPERDVRTEVARAMTAIPDSKYLDHLMPMLADSRLRPEARKAILAVGPVALYFLDEALWDDSLPRRVRRHIPRSISRFEPAAAGEILLAHLSDEEDEVVRFKILRGLGRLRAESPDLALDERALREMCRRFLRRMIQVLSLRLAIEAAHADDPSRKTRGGELLRGILAEKEETILERIFRVLGLLHPNEDFELIYRGLTRRGRRGRAQSRELLDHVLRGEIRAALLALVDDAPDADRLAKAEAATGYAQSPPSYEHLLLTMLEDSSEAVQSVAAYHIGELGLSELADELREAGAQSESFLGEVVERALSALGASRLEKDPHAA